MKKILFLSLICFSSIVSAQEFPVAGPITVNADETWTPPGGYDGFIFETSADPSLFLRVTNNATLDVAGILFNNSYLYVDEGATLTAYEFTSHAGSSVEVNGDFYINDSIHYDSPYKWSSWTLSTLKIGSNGYMYSRYGAGNADANTNWLIEGILDTDRLGVSCSNSNDCEVIVNGGTIIARNPVDPDTAGYDYAVQNGGANFVVQNGGVIYSGYTWTDTNVDDIVQESELVISGNGDFYNSRRNIWGVYTDTSTTHINDGKIKVAGTFYNGVDSGADSKPSYVFIGGSGEGILEAETYNQTHADSTTSIYNNGLMTTSSAIEIYGGLFEVAQGGRAQSTGNVEFFNSTGVIEGNLIAGDLELSNANLLVSGAVDVSNTLTIGNSGNLQINFASNQNYGQVNAGTATFDAGSGLYLQGSSYVYLSPETQWTLIETNNLITTLGDLSTTWSHHFEDLVLYDAVIGLSDDGTDVVLRFDRRADADQAAVRFDGVSLASRSFQNASLKAVNTRLHSMRMAQKNSKSYELASLASDSSLSLQRQEENSVWVQTFIMTGKYDGDSIRNLQAYDTDFSGISLGYDYKVIKGTRLGFALHHARGDIAGKSSAFDIDAETSQVSVYSSTDFDLFYVNGLIGYGWSDYDQKRYSGSTAHTAGYNGTQYSAAIQVGVEFKSGEWMLSPYLGFDYSQMTIDTYTESSGLVVEEQNQDLVQSKIGGIAQYQSVLEGGDIFAPYLTLEIGYDAGKQAAIELLDGSGLIKTSYNSVDLGDTLGRVGVGFSFMAVEGWQWGMEYEYEQRNNYQSHVGMLKGRLFF